MQTTRIPSGLAVNKKLIEKWAHPIGTEVIVVKDDGKEVRMKTESAPFLLGGHTACIMLDGISGAYALSRVRKV